MGKNNKKTELVRTNHTETPAPRPKVCLVDVYGDSTIDNKSYVEKDQDTLTQLRLALGKLVSSEQTFLLRNFSRDGATINSVLNGVSRIWPLESKPEQPVDSRIAVLSVGGNDISYLLHKLGDAKRIVSWLDITTELSTEAFQFKTKYEALTDILREKYDRVVLATIYRPDVDDSRKQVIVDTMLPIFNDLIRQVQYNYPGTLSLVEYDRILRPHQLVFTIEPGAEASRIIGADIAGLCASMASGIVRRKGDNFQRFLPSEQDIPDFDLAEYDGINF